jgi:hypothetical protein
MLVMLVGLKTGILTVTFFGDQAVLEVGMVTNCVEFRRL